MKARRSGRLWVVYAPLLLNIVPAVAINYLWLFPRNGVSGWNETTIGFVATNAGFVLTYITGVGLARRRPKEPDGPSVDETRLSMRRPWE